MAGLNSTLLVRKKEPREIVATNAATRPLFTQNEFIKLIVLLTYDQDEHGALLRSTRGHSRAELDATINKDAF